MMSRLARRQSSRLAFTQPLHAIGFAARRARTGFTFIELIVVVIIVAILAGLAIPNFTKTKERAFDKEAQTSLRLVQAAEKIYNLKNSFYYPISGSVTNLGEVNSNLLLDLSSSSWNFSIGSVTGTDFVATAARTDSSRIWRMQKGSANPVCSGTCP